MYQGTPLGGQKRPKNSQCNKTTKHRDQAATEGREKQLTCPCAHFNTQNPSGDNQVTQQTTSNSYIDYSDKNSSNQLNVIRKKGPAAYTNNSTNNQIKVPTQQQQHWSQQRAGHNIQPQAHSCASTKKDYQGQHTPSDPPKDCQNHDTTQQIPTPTTDRQLQL